MQETARHEDDRRLGGSHNDHGGGQPGQGSHDHPLAADPVTETSPERGRDGQGEGGGRDGDPRPGLWMAATPVTPMLLT